MEKARICTPSFDRTCSRVNSWHLEASHCVPFLDGRLRQPKTAGQEVGVPTVLDVKRRTSAIGERSAIATAHHPAQQKLPLRQPCRSYRTSPKLCGACQGRTGSQGGLADKLIGIFCMEPFSVSFGKRQCGPSQPHGPEPRPAISAAHLHAVEISDSGIAFASRHQASADLAMLITPDVLSGRPSRLLCLE